MKWTNPERLDVYGVRLVGWPPSIPARNPSSLKLPQNKLLLECLQNGTMKFEKSLMTLTSTGDLGNPSTDIANNLEEAEVTDDFSWAYDADGGCPSVGFLSPYSIPLRVNIHQVDLHNPSSLRTWNDSASDFRDPNIDPRSDSLSAQSYTSMSITSPSRKRPRSNPDVTG
jgi:hypothetical protein